MNVVMLGFEGVQHSGAFVQNSSRTPNVLPCGCFLEPAIGRCHQ